MTADRSQSAAEVSPKNFTGFTKENYRQPIEMASQARLNRGQAMLWQHSRDADTAPVSRVHSLQKFLSDFAGNGVE